MSCLVGFKKKCGANSQTLNFLLGGGKEWDEESEGTERTRTARTDSTDSTGRTELTAPTTVPDLMSVDEVDADPEQIHHHHHRIGGARSDVFLTLGGVSGIENELMLDRVRSSNLNFAKSIILPTSQRAHRGKAIPAGAAVKVQKSTRPLVLFPPIFDSRLFYRSAHHPYVIHDQGSCASCVFISATSMAQARAAIQMSKVNAAAVWRAILREERGWSDDQVAASLPHTGESSSEAFRSAARRFVEIMSQQGEWGGAAARMEEEEQGGQAGRSRRSARRIPSLQWKHYICCETKSACVAGSRSQGSKAASACYHHKDEPSDKAPFTCDVHADGVVPHHFLEWIRDGERGFVDETHRRIIRTIRPEHKGMSPEFSLVHPIEIVPGTQLTEADTRRIAEQVRAIKASLMSNGPVLAMIRIEGKSFDTWGEIKKPKAKSEQAGDKQGERSEQGGKGKSDQGEDEEAADGEDVELDENSLLGQVRRRRAYRLPGRDAFDEYHEVMVVGWSYDDFGTPCWIVQNSYGPTYNSHCAISPWTTHELDPWLGDVLDSTLQQGYAQSGLMNLRGCVFVEMVNSDLVTSGCTTDLENNVLSFVPVVDESNLMVDESKQELMAVYSDPDTPYTSAGAGGSASQEQEETASALWIVGFLLVVVAVAAVWLNKPAVWLHKPAAQFSSPIAAGVAYPKSSSE